MRFILFMLLMLASTTLLSQKVILYEPQHAFYTKMENYVWYYAAGYKPSSLVFKTNNGKVSQFRNMLIFLPDTVGKAIFTIYKKQKGKQIPYDSLEVIVYENKSAEALLGTKTGGDIEKSLVVALGALIAKVSTRTTHSEPIRIKSYTIIFHKSDGTIQYYTNTGNRFNDKAFELIRELQSGERITFTNIQAECSWLPSLTVKAIEFTIR